MTLSALELGKIVQSVESLHSHVGSIDSKMTNFIDRQNNIHIQMQSSQSVMENVQIGMASDINLLKKEVEHLKTDYLVKKGSLRVMIGGISVGTSALGGVLVLMIQHLLK